MSFLRANALKRTVLSPPSTSFLFPPSHGGGSGGGVVGSARHGFHWRLRREACQTCGESRRSCEDFAGLRAESHRGAGGPPSATCHGERREQVQTLPQERISEQTAEPTDDDTRAGEEVLTHGLRRVTGTQLDGTVGMVVKCVPLKDEDPPKNWKMLKPGPWTLQRVCLAGERDPRGFSCLVSVHQPWRRMNKQPFEWLVVGIVRANLERAEWTAHIAVWRQGERTGGFFPCMWSTRWRV